MNRLIIDFETGSKCDITTAGTDNYTSHPTTFIICIAAMDVETGQSWLWYPDAGLLPDDLVRAFTQADRVIAHNARFEQGIWEWIGVNDHEFPLLDEERWYCSSAQCRVNALPASLDDAARAINPKYRKNPEGKSLIKQLSLPQADGTFNKDPDLIARMGAYCMDDVTLTREILQRTRPMTDQEHDDWLINERINDRGVRIDRELACLAVSYATHEQAEISEKLDALTHGVVTKHTQHLRIKKYILDHLRRLPPNDPVIKLMEVGRVNGVVRYSLDKPTRTEILNQLDTGKITLRSPYRELLKLIDTASRSSVAKFDRMLERANPTTDRVEGAFVYAGASQTLRFASRGLQLHNMRRACWNAEETERLKMLMRSAALLRDQEGEPLSVMDTLSKLLRPALIPAPGHVFVVGDWSAIEARALPWLADTEESREVLNVFREHDAGLSDQDIYEKTAEDLKLADRNIGKVATLALGYGGGLGAFKAMARAYDVRLDDDEINAVVVQWRHANPWAKEFWDMISSETDYAIQKAIDSVNSRAGKICPVGRLTYHVDAGLLNRTLICTLPGGSTIQYPAIAEERIARPYGHQKVIRALKASFKPTPDAVEWPRITLWSGHLCENVTQAFCASLLRNALKVLHDKGLPVVAHVHDEILIEVPENQAEEAKKKLKKIMETPPDWAEGLPLKADPKVMTRYGK